VSTYDHLREKIERLRYCQLCGKKHRSEKARLRCRRGAGSIEKDQEKQKPEAGKSMNTYEHLRESLVERVEFAHGMLPAKSHGAQHWAVEWANRLYNALSKRVTVKKFSIKPMGNVKADAEVVIEVDGEIKKYTLELHAKSRFANNRGMYPSWVRINGKTNEKAGTRALAQKLIGEESEAMSTYDHLRESLKLTEKKTSIGMAVKSVKEIKELADAAHQELQKDGVSKTLMLITNGIEDKAKKLGQMIRRSIPHTDIIGK
jgi:hypothetical protein